MTAVAFNSSNCQPKATRDYTTVVLMGTLASLSSFDSRVSYYMAQWKYVGKSEI